MSTLTAPRAASSSAVPDSRDNVLSAELQERWRALTQSQHSSASRSVLIESYSWVGAILVAMAVFVVGVLTVGWGTWAVVAGNEWDDSHPTFTFWGMLVTVLIGTALVVKISATLGSWTASATCWLARRTGPTGIMDIHTWWLSVDQDLRSSGRPGLRHPDRARGSFAVLDDGSLVDVRIYPEESAVWLRSGFSSWITR